MLKKLMQNKFYLERGIFLVDSQIKYPDLAPVGRKKIEWAKGHMPVLGIIRKDFQEKKPFSGFRIALCLHLEAKTAVLAQTLKEGGGEIVAVASNPLSTQDDVVAALVENGVTVCAWHGATMGEYNNHLKRAAESFPHLVIDDGGDLVTMLHHDYAEATKNVIGGAEETTTGILRLKNLAQKGHLRFPMIAVNDASSKFLFDNRYGTGQSVWDGIMRTTNLVVAGKTVVIVGYGWCGKGVALRAKGLGARIIVCEIDPIKANEALMDGYEVKPLLEAAALGDFFITVTGNFAVVRKEHFQRMKDGAILANAGHFDVEISKPDLESLSVETKEARPNITSYIFDDGRQICLLSEGRLVNLAAGDGHPAEIMDMSFSLQALSLLYLLRKGKELSSAVWPVPEEVDREVASLRLQALGITIDSLTPEQKDYLEGRIY
jgi:adenosylhomocysteinase